MSQPGATIDPPAEAANQLPKVTWDDSKMETSYANALNVSSTREEVSVFFGTNQTWHFDERKEFKIQLSHRMVLNPYAAKRLSLLLSRVMGEYERRFGALSIDGSDTPQGG